MAKLQAMDAHRDTYNNTLARQSQYNAQTSGTHQRSDRWLAHFFPDHVIDGVSAGVRKGLGLDSSPAPTPVVGSSLAYQFRFKESEALAHNLTLLAQGLTAVIAPAAMAWSAVRAAHLLKASALGSFISHPVTQGIGQVAAAGVIFHSDPSALALPQKPFRKKRVDPPEAVTEPIKTSTKVVHDWELGNTTTGQRYRTGWLERTLKEIKDPDPFTEFTVSTALEIADSVTKAEVLDAVKNRKPGQPLVVKPLPGLDILIAYGKNHPGK